MTGDSRAMLRAVYSRKSLLLEEIFGSMAFHDPCLSICLASPGAANGERVGATKAALNLALWDGVSVPSVLTYQELETSPVAGDSRVMLRAVHSRKSLLLEEILGSSRHSCRKLI